VRAISEGSSCAIALATVVPSQKTLIQTQWEHAQLSFGLTTLQTNMEVNGSSVKFRRAKDGVMQTIQIKDAQIARIVKRYRALPGKALFQYLDENGKRQCVDSAAVRLSRRSPALYGEELPDVGGHGARRVCGLPPARVHLRRSVQTEHR
jgi:hypothetical protein